MDPPRIYDGQDIDNPFVHIVYEIVPSVDTPAGIFYDVIKETIYSKIDGQEFITRIQYVAKGVASSKMKIGVLIAVEHIYILLY